MQIECSLSTKPLGVRGQGPAAFVFCPNPIKKKKKGLTPKVTVLTCQNCKHYCGEHKAMNVDFVYKDVFGEENVVEDDFKGDGYQ